MFKVISTTLTQEQQDYIHALLAMPAGERLHVLEAMVMRDNLVVDIRLRQQDGALIEHIEVSTAEEAAREN